jgi:hypothetical protein
MITGAIKSQIDQIWNAFWSGGLSKPGGRAAVIVPEDFLRRAVLYWLVHHFLVAVERKVIALSSDIGLGHTEALRGARALTLSAITLGPMRQYVRQVVLGVLLGSQGRARDPMRRREDRSRAIPTL